ncbi:ABC transporter permease [Clostridium rectalis]|uniref:ABC transporter permease n=1 Tax=Clostridium rectalis TaxID=2040295 RepID=UPI000F63BEB8|nr:ABC transporter permease [Clostridium rectalis]
MSNLIRGELYKLKKSKYFIIMIILAVLTSLLLINSFDSNVKSMHPALINGVYSISYAFQRILFTSFLFSLLAGEFICKDLKRNMSNSFIFGYKRSEIILSKITVFIMCFLFLEFIYITILAIYVSINYGFCEVLNKSTILYLIRVIIIGIMYNVATISIVSMVAIITKSSLVTATSPILFILCFSLLNLKSPILSILRLLPFIIGGGAITRFAPKSIIIGGIISSVLTFIITTVVSILYVKGEDIK